MLKIYQKCIPLGVTLLFSRAALAYPDKPVRVFMSLGAGGAADVLVCVIQLA
jgi:tripartite-type tricarboxylate transporter receptor subunit TctC